MLQETALPSVHEKLKSQTDHPTAVPIFNQITATLELLDPRKSGLHICLDQHRASVYGLKKSVQGRLITSFYEWSEESITKRARKTHAFHDTYKSV